MDFLVLAPDNDERHPEMAMVTSSSGFVLYDDPDDRPPMPPPKMSSYTGSWRDGSASVAWTNDQDVLNFLSALDRVEGQPWSPEGYELPGHGPVELVTAQGTTITVRISVEWMPRKGLTILRPEGLGYHTLRIVPGLVEVPSRVRVIELWDADLPPNPRDSQ
jgi:hypothetical protein